MCWCLCVGIWQPRMEWEHWHLDGKANEHSSKDPDLGVLRDLSTILNEIWNGETFCTSCEEQGEEGHQHKSRAEHCVEEELE